MIAIEILSPGGPEVLVPVERPVPAPASDELLVKVAAAGVNRPDVFQRLGNYPPPHGVTDIPGLEVAGTVEQVGAGIAGWKVGDRVCALVAGGGYAEYCVAPAPQCLPMPRGFDFVTAAAIPETYFTVWTNVFQRGRLVSGESILIHGGSSGIGTTAIQLARALGSRVFATAGSAEKCAACERLGAVRAINYREEDFVSVVRGLTGGQGRRCHPRHGGGRVLHSQPGRTGARRTAGRDRDVARCQGRTEHSEGDAAPSQHYRVDAPRARAVSEKGAIAAAVYAHVWPLLESGDVRPVIHATFPLQDAASAHTVMDAGTHIGKLVLTTTAPARIE